MTKPDRDLQDVRCILAELARFQRMTTHELVGHQDSHPEDRFAWLDLPDNSLLPMSRIAANAFSSLTERQVETLGDGDDFDLAVVERQIRGSFVDSFLIERRPVQTKWIDRVLSRAIKKARADHQELVHYVACVLTQTDTPEMLKIGPVTFVTSRRFLSENSNAIRDDLATHDARARTEIDHRIAKDSCDAPNRLSQYEAARESDLAFREVTAYFEVYRWVAGVRVGPCAPAVSRRRAERVVQGALDVLKLLLGPTRGGELRLGHEMGRTLRSVDLTVGSDGLFRSVMKWASEGAVIEASWFEKATEGSDWRRLLTIAGENLEVLTLGEGSSDLRGRWLDALHWYGQAVSEPQRAAQLVKYVAALERLTVTARSGDVTDTVTRRAALLGVVDEREIGQARGEAKIIYDWRSSLMHGRVSPTSRHVAKALRLAHRLVRQAMLNALVLYAGLHGKGTSTPKALEARFTELEIRLVPPSAKF